MVQVHLAAPICTSTEGKLEVKRSISKIDEVNSLSERYRCLPPYLCVIITMDIPWWENEWFLEWERLARRDYHGQRNVPLFGY